ncbi:uncharacterized protein V6R79_008898 [Siganus canaliculatus]
MFQGLLRKYLWLWVLLGMVFVSLVISLIFLIINKCLLRRGKHRISNLHRRSKTALSNKYQEANIKAGIPPLPPRTQFLTAEAQSYENLTERNLPSSPGYAGGTHDHAGGTHDHAGDSHDYEKETHDYEQATSDYEQATPDYVQATPDYEQATSDYEQATPDYEPDMADYVKVEEEQTEHILPPPPPPPTQYIYPDPPEDDASTEDYDDIGGAEDGEDGEEDYDDVG